MYYIYKTSVQVPSKLTVSFSILRAALLLNSSCLCSLSSSVSSSILWPALILNSSCLRSLSSLVSFSNLWAALCCADCRRLCLSSSVSFCNLLITLRRSSQILYRSHFHFFHYIFLYVLVSFSQSLRRFLTSILSSWMRHFAVKFSTFDPLLV